MDFEEIDIYLEESPTFADIDSLAKQRKLKAVLDIDEVHFEDAEGNTRFYCNWPLLNVEPEDIPYLESTKLYYLINLTSVTESVSAIEFATNLAKRLKGIVYGPQNGELIFSKKTPGKRVKEKKELVTLLTLMWFLLDKFDGEKIEKTLCQLQEHASFCMPKRFGGAPPFQGSLERDGWKGFAETCAKQQSDSLGSVYWTATRPCLEGKISLPTPLQLSRLLSNEKPVSTIKLELDCEMLERQGELQTCKKLLVNLAVELNAIYAAVLVNHDVPYSSGNLGGASWDFGNTTYWGGIPDVRTWITWFSPDLIERVAGNLPKELLEHDGHLLQLGQTPKTPDELVGLFPNIPDHLINLDGSFSPSFRFTNRNEKARYRPKNSTV